jgi:hypothetical protein
VALVLLMATNVSAIRVTIPSEVVVMEGQVTQFPIMIENTSSHEKGLVISYSAPTQNRFLNVPQTIAGGESVEITVELQPNNSLTGSVYTSSVNVKLSDESAVRTNALIFVPAQTINTPNTPTPNTPTTGFFSLGLVGNDSILNIILILVAAVLLLAFIARFVKRVA